MTLKFIRMVASVFMVGILIAACEGTEGENGASSSGGNSCDEMTKGFVKCGDFNTCQPGTFCVDPTFGMCENGCASNVNCGCGEVCTGDKCTLNDVCGDAKCSGSETASSCPADCTGNSCGNGTCDGNETPASCPADCMVMMTCGDGSCDVPETLQSCPEDCDMCGDGFCDAGETEQNCAQDCSMCGNGMCDGTETPQNCMLDCGLLLFECKDHCDGYNFFMCFQPGELQACYDSCDAATAAQLKQFNTCAAQGGSGTCEAMCFDNLP